jgi:hypothetical protein
VFSVNFTRTPVSFRSCKTKNINLITVPLGTMVSGDFPDLSSGFDCLKALTSSETVRQHGASDTLVKEPNRPFPSSIKGNHFMQNRFAVS